jgi:hypothetical protein
MAKEHIKVAKTIPGSVIRCGPRRMLHHICQQCGSGQPFKTKGGKIITMPEGVYQCTDKEMMKVLGTNRRETVRENRKTMKEACKGAVKVTYEFKQGFRYPTIVYHVFLEMLADLTPTKSVYPKSPKRVGSTDTGSVGSKTKGYTESAAHTGDAEHLLGHSTSPEAGEGVVSGEAGGSATRTRSAAQRDAADVDASTDPYVQTLHEHMEGLKLHGWTGKVKPEIVSEIASKLQLVGIEVHQINLLFNWMVAPKQAWILAKTKGRFDWLRDRICKPQDLDNSLLQRFLNDEEAAQLMNSVPVGEIDTDEAGTAAPRLRDCEFCLEALPTEYTGMTDTSLKIACLTCASARGEKFTGYQPKPWEQPRTKKFEMEIEYVEGEIDEPKPAPKPVKAPEPPPPVKREPPKPRCHYAGVNGNEGRCSKPPVDGEIFCEDCLRTYKFGINHGVEMPYYDKYLTKAVEANSC